MMTVGSLFAGIGGFDLGLERAGMTVKWQVEIDSYCLKVLEKHWPHVKRYTDIKAVEWSRVEPVDLICGGFPCQDISNAGKRAGIGKLNPQWVEWLMGYPGGWTDCEDSATPSSRKSSNGLDGAYSLSVKGDRYELRQGKTVIHVRPINGKKVSQGDKR